MTIWGIHWLKETYKHSGARGFWKRTSTPVQALAPETHTAKPMRLC